MSTEGSKELHRMDNIVIAVYDGRNFTVYEEETIKKGKTKGEIVHQHQTYHAYLHTALSNAALRVAGRDADTIEEYLKTYRDTARMLAKATGGV